MQKCRLCKQEEREFIWQPELNYDGKFLFPFPGYHTRGFMTVGICEKCMKRIQNGETFEFTYKKYFLVRASTKEYSCKDIRENKEPQAS